MSSIIMNMKHRWTLYVLKLESGKWYVGITSKSPEERFKEHLAKKRSAYWTMRYRPIAIELVEDLGVVSKEHAEKYESKITRSLMKERGINNVRGGDLRHVEEYVQGFGYFWSKDNLRDVFTMIFILLLLGLLMVDKYIVQFIPGGVR